jgi:hypothetical protein
VSRIATMTFRRNPWNNTRVRYTGLLPFLLCALALAALPTVGAASPVARAAASCSIPHGGEHLGPTYLTSLSVTATSCSTGLTVVREYHNCQLKHGGVKAKCTAKVDGFSCQEKRGPAIATEFFSSVMCTSGAKHVSYKYSQFS